jgi:hypothetical protein
VSDLLGSRRGGFFWSENVPAHAHVHDHAKGKHHGSKRGTAIAHHRQRYSDHGHNTRHHGDVDNDVPKHDRDHAEGEQGAETVFGALNLAQTVSDHNKIEHQQNCAANKAPLLGKNRKNEIGMLRR